jgi:hypothetical protein
MNSGDLKVSCSMYLQDLLLIEVSVCQSERANSGWLPALNDKNSRSRKA